MRMLTVCGLAVLSIALLAFWVAFWLIREGFRMVHYSWFACAGYPWMAGHIGASGVALCVAGICVGFWTCVAAVIAFEANTSVCGSPLGASTQDGLVGNSESTK